ncbi:MAG: bacterial transcriptional activator domain-containing protein [Caldilineaceae bacterium]
MALRSYERCVAVLDEEFGVEPLPGTTELYERILHNEHIQD